MSGRIVSIIVFFFLALASCGIPSTQLAGSKIRVPKDPNIYNKRAKFDSSILKYIDTGVVYEEIGSKDNSGLHLRWFKDYEMYNYGILRFYPNGFMNFFVVYKDPPWKLDEFDPVNGSLGIYYKETDIIKGAFFFKNKRRFKRHKLNITPKGDTLFIIWSNSINRQEVYIKKRLAPEYLKFKTPE